jgi:hypothetical protein
MTDDYPYIRAWGRLIGSAPQYTDNRVTQARDENAPNNAVFRSLDGQWLTTDEILLPETRAALGLRPLPYRPIDIEHLVHQLHLAIAADGPMTYLYGLDTIQPQPGNASLRLTFATGLTADIRVVVHEPSPPNTTKGASSSPGMR